MDEIDFSKLAIGSVVPGTVPIISMDFHEKGELCVTTASDSSIVLVNALEGKVRKVVRSQKYGTGTIRYTHHDQSVLVSSDNAEGDHAVRYLSLYDNKFLRAFQGHTDKVVTIAMSPVDDCFMTSAYDRTVRMWNLTAPECIGVLQFPEGSSAPQAAYDPCGLIFAVTACIGDANLVKLFDARSFEQGPFTTFTLTHETVAAALQQKVAGMTRKVATSLSRAQWLNLKFSPNGANILVSTDVGVVIILDAYDCKIEQVLTGHKNDQRSDIEACWSPDAKHVLCGSEDHSIYVWSAQDGSFESQLTGHTATVSRVLCSPKYQVVASACTNTCLWVKQPVS